MMDRFKLTYENIEEAVESVSAFLENSKIEEKDILRLKLAFEDTLLNYRDEFGEDTLCGLKCVRHFGSIRIELSVSGNSCDVFSSGGEEDFSRMLMSGIGMAPVWRYKNGQNIIIFSPRKKKPSQMVYILAAIFLAVICGIVSQAFPESVRNVISQQVLAPLTDTFLGLLNSTAGVMIFLSVVWGICSIGDIADLTNIGKKMIGRMFLMMALIPTIFMLCIMPLFDFSLGAGTEAFNLFEPFEMILGIIPADIISPFKEGNFLQIIFIASTVGTALLVLGSKTTLASSFTEQANTVVQLILEAVCSFIPLLIFMSLYDMILSGSFSALIDAYKIPLLVLVGCFFAMAIYFCLVVFKYKVKPMVFLKKAMPSFLIGLTTASSSAAMPTVMEACEKDYGINKKIVNFGVPLGRILFGIGSVTEFIVLGLSMAEIYSSAVTPAWIFMLLLTSVVLKIATPPIPGGSVAICTILFNQLGLPLEGLAVAVAIDIIADFLLTATDIFCLQSELIILSGKLGMIDVGKLQKRKS